ncbi:hypothetical protein [Psychrobacter sp. CAL346-MNA-CIBAN-0220]|uniref:hypothetical protein n=1 Tax=Psychrobacter sp. CAL346-MNA-CIBAN-0220 TaxID=3140457 RepID=UPI0033302656
MTTHKKMLDEKDVVVSSSAAARMESDEEKVVVNDPAAREPDNTRDSYEGRKHDPNIKGPQQESQETDEIYSDPRKEENLPPGGKNVGDLRADDLSQEGNDI